MEILYFAVIALIVIVFLLQIQINKLKSENKELREWYFDLHEHINGYFEKQISINENVRTVLYNLSGIKKED